MSHRVNRLAAALVLAGCANLAHAAGFALIEQNASGLGNAYAGQAAAATDASTIFFNPAGMTYLPDRQGVAAGHLIKPQAEFTGTVTPAIGGGNGGDAGGLALVPNAYFAFRLTPDVHLGVGMNAPFGLKTEYDATWKGRTQAVKSELKTINLNPSIAWKASESLSLGAGVSIQYAEATLTNSAGGAGLATVKGDDYGWGYNLGALWQASEATRIGLAYRSEVEQTLAGDVGFSTVASLDGPVNAGITLPDSASLSLFHKLSPKWDLLADVTWTGWSDFKELRIVRNSGAVLAVTPENWDDSYRYSLGANYHLNDKLTLRGGFAFDETPVSDASRTARIPDEDRTWIAFGAQYRLSRQSAINVGYAHLFVKDARINKTEDSYLPPQPNPPTPVTLSGTYKASVDILSAQLTLNF
ncbi:OmpP1/FadL family transporter [Thiobacillus denitrificans]|uniref:Aromatic hydrocarbon degradation protein n=1 Tax=Thiobacillus denitrificans TaxID=36861 RepID=A0A119CWH9_THIDE|nr:outer membrane protein transport protein [Thiobacillus denitrificans]KVW96664.1 aromatic hydrocarbon degradation protein [Thiobacillus denitrificans]